jgi:transcriptional regulator with XRE-family HTH domain
MPRRSPTRLDAGSSHQVGARIKNKREEAGLTLEEVSARTGISISSLSRLENGIYQLTVPQLEALATALRCSSTNLLTTHTEGGGSFGAT